MATTEQINANRENAKLSSGPTSPEGAARSSQNALKHGLTGRTVHLTKSEEEPYRLFHEGLFTDLCPKGANEEYLVEALIDSRWRIAQISKIEAGLYLIGEIENKAELANYPSEKREEACRALTFSKKQKEFDKLNRYQGRLQRQAANDLKKLEELQTTRMSAELKAFQEACSVLIQASQGPDPDSFEPADFGFVWSKQDMIDYLMAAKHRTEASARYPTANTIKYSDVPPIAA
jgi:hypothetical protein